MRAGPKRVEICTLCKPCGSVMRKQAFALHSPFMVFSFVNHISCHLCDKAFRGFFYQHPFIDVLKHLVDVRGDPLGRRHQLEEFHPLLLQGVPLSGNELGDIDYKSVRAESSKNMLAYFYCRGEVADALASIYLFFGQTE